MFLILIGVLIIAFYYYGTRNFDYWEKQGVKYEKPLFLVGSSLKMFIDKVGSSERFVQLYRAFPNERFVGFFKGTTPAILIRDPEVVQQILQSDFRYFHKRGIYPPNISVEPLMKNIFTVDGDVWKLMRQKLTPAFSSGKLKAMFPLIVERTEKLTKIADDLAKIGDEVDVRELMARYTTDFIGACGFGLDSIALGVEDSAFRTLGQRLFNLTKRDHIVGLLKMILPRMFQNLRFIDPIVETNILSIINQIMTQRDYKPSGRNDFIDQMLGLKQKGKIVGESIDKRNSDGSPKNVELELDELLVAAQVFIFFAAGFETSSSASSYLLHQLACNPEVQKRCQKEVDEVMKKHDGKLSFDSVKEMKYLEMALKEAIRFMPSPGYLMRQATSKYTIPGTNVTLKENTKVIISIEALGKDEKYFKDPESFIPERFHPDNIDQIQKCTYLPFGEGPRSCIGERMGIMQSMAGVATILKDFSVSPSRNTRRKPIVDRYSSFVQTIVGGLPLKITRRTN